MQLQMIRYGMIAGFAFLLGITLMDWLSRPAEGVATAAGEADISDQVWQVLAEARRILEESA